MTRPMLSIAPGFRPALSVIVAAMVLACAGPSVAQIGPTPMPKIKSPPIIIPGQCVWRGTAPFCSGRCRAGERTAQTSKTGGGRRCVTGHKVLCCRR